jgi:hypothetical protein
MQPGSKKWKKRVAQVLAEESTEPLCWFYCSFADDDGFRGAIFMKAKGITHFVREATRLGINPGGQVMGVKLADTDALPAEKYRNRLLDKKNLEEAVGAIVRTDGTDVA